MKRIDDLNNEKQAACIIAEQWGESDPLDMHTAAARALAEDNLLAPELPEANDPTAIFVPGGKGWLLENEDTGPNGPLVWTAPGGLVMIQRIEPGELVPEDAEEFARNILAAAQYAKKKKS